MMQSLLPWHDIQWQPLLRRLNDGVLPHALLLSGRRGLGKDAFALAFAQALLCERRGSDGTACGTCRACRLNEAQTHPDLNPVRIPEDKTGIGIDQIRELTRYLALKSQYGGHRVVIVSPADAMNRHAANSLLKTLEEPPAGSLLMLVTAHPAALPATIRSRCQQLAFRPPPEPVARAWLAERIGACTHSIDHPLRDPARLELALRLADGAPLAAAELAAGDRLDRRGELFGGFEQVVSGTADPVAVAAEWLKFDAGTTIYWLYGWVTDMIRLRTGTGSAPILNSDLRAPLQQLAGRYSPRALFGQLDRVIEAGRIVDSPINTQLLLEDLLIAWDGQSR